MHAWNEKEEKERQHSFTVVWFLVSISGICFSSSFSEFKSRKCPMTLLWQQTILAVQHPADIYVCHETRKQKNLIKSI